MHEKTITIVLIVLSFLPLLPACARGQEESRIDINLSIESSFSIHGATNRLAFPTCPPDTTVVTEEPFLVTVDTNTMGVYLTFNCTSPQGDLVRSLIKQESLDTWYIITEEAEPPPGEDDPRWIPGKQLIGYIYPIMSTGATEVRIFSKIRSVLAEKGLYRDLWNITAANGEREDTIPMNVDCEVE